MPVAVASEREPVLQKAKERERPSPFFPPPPYANILFFEDWPPLVVNTRPAPAYTNSPSCSSSLQPAALALANRPPSVSLRKPVRSVAAAAYPLRSSPGRPRTGSGGPRAPCSSSWNQHTEMSNKRRRAGPSTYPHVNKPTKQTNNDLLLNGALAREVLLGGKGGLWMMWVAIEVGMRAGKEGYISTHAHVHTHTNQGRYVPGRARPSQRPSPGGRS